MSTFTEILCLTLAITFFTVACSEKKPTEVAVFTLYRNAPSDETFRAHVATFDAGSDGTGDESYNWDNMKNCERAQKMFQAQPYMGDVRFWCEKGRFKK